MAKIQVSSSAEERDIYNKNFSENIALKHEWIKKEPQVELLTHFINNFFLDTTIPRFKHQCFRQNGKFIVGNKETLAIVHVQGGKGFGNSGYDTNRYTIPWSNPGNWQTDDNCEYKVTIYPQETHRTDYRALAGNNGNPSSFGSLLSANGGLGAPQVITKYAIYKRWHLHGWASIWDWGSGRWRYDKQETITYHSRANNQNIPDNATFSPSIGECKIGFFLLAPEQEVEISVGNGGSVDVSYMDIEEGVKSDILAHIKTHHTSHEHKDHIH